VVVVVVVVVGLGRERVHDGCDGGYTTTRGEMMVMGWLMIEETLRGHLEEGKRWWFVSRSSRGGNSGSRAMVMTGLPLLLS